jgi:hypothetical protein
MDEEQVKSLIAEALGGFKSSFSTEIGGLIDSKNSGLAANLNREFKKLTESLQPKTETTDSGESGKGAGAEKPEAKGSDDTKLTLKALQTQLQQLQQERDREQTQRKLANRQAALATAVAKAKPLAPGVLQTFLDATFGETLKEENGNWYVAQGDSVKSIDDAIAAFLQSGDGKNFLPPSGTQGAGSTESKSTTTTTVEPGSSTEALMSAF